MPSGQYIAGGMESHGRFALVPRTDLYFFELIQFEFIKLKFVIEFKLFVVQQFIKFDFVEQFHGFVRKRSYADRVLDELAE